MEPHKNFLSTFMAAFSTCSLYSPEHPSVEALIGKSLSTITEFFAENESFEIMMVEDDLIVNKSPTRDEGSLVNNLKKRMKRKGVSRIDFLKGLTAPEFAGFIEDFTDKNKPFRSYPHIKTGVVELRAGELQPLAEAEADGLGNATAAQLEMAKEIFNSISPFKKLNVAGLEEIVVNFFITFKREAHFLKLISPVKSHSEYTYTHAANVAVLSMFQAEALGINDEMLHEIGIAALLHDVGKLFLSRDILNKKGKLTDEEFQEVTRHTITGANYLVGMKGLTQLAPIVAFEHHMRYDGTGYPKLNNKRKKQHLVSQVVQIADFFDALRSKRPYKKDWEIKDIIALMMENSGREFNGVLVFNFARIVHLAISE